MSTRCQIGFYEKGNNDILKPDALLYRHCDGYPGTVDGSKYGLLTDLVPFLTLFHKRRGLDDIEYAAAWTMHHLIDLHVTSVKELRAQSETDKSYFHEDGRDCIGFGVCNGFHGDIAYYYAVRGATLTVYAVDWPMQDDEPQEKHFRKLEVVQLAPQGSRRLL